MVVDVNDPLADLESRPMRLKFSRQLAAMFWVL